MMIVLFDFGHNNRLSLGSVYADDEWDQQIGIWLSGRLFGRYVSVLIPWRTRKG